MLIQAKGTNTHRRGPFTFKKEMASTRHLFCLIIYFLNPLQDTATPGISKPICQQQDEQNGRANGEKG